MITNKSRKTIRIDKNGRSADFIASFGHGCLYKCLYCTMRRYKHTGVNIPTNVDDILIAIANHSKQLGKKIPNQVHDKLWLYDIACTEDFCLHAKYYDWRKIFDFFRDTPRIGATMATKYVNIDLLNYNPDQQIRIRFSLMPQELSTVLEPDTTLIIDRIKAINDFREAGYDVHINFSPIIIHPGSLKLYIDLFKQIKSIVTNINELKSECIFLTHSERLHNFNILNGHTEAEDLLWKPGFQELKQSQFQSNVLRYKWQYKNKCKNKFLYWYNQIIPEIKIRYIFFKAKIMNNLIGITGKKGSGKDTVADIIRFLIQQSRIGEETSYANYIDWGRLNDVQYEKDYKIKRFADPVKRFVADVLGVRTEKLEDREFKEKELGEEWVYYEGQKTGIVRSQEWFSNNFNSYEEGYKKGWTKRIHTPHTLLQKIGTEGGRFVHPNLHINAMFKDYREKVDFDNNLPPNKKWIIPDVRFDNEAEAIKDRGGIVIRVSRDIGKSCTVSGEGNKVFKILEVKPGYLYLSDAGGWEKKSNCKIISDTYTSETGISDELVDIEIDNNGTIEDLINEVKIKLEL